MNQATYRYRGLAGCLALLPGLAASAVPTADLLPPLVIVQSATSQPAPLLLAEVKRRRGDVAPTTEPAEATPTTEPAATAPTTAPAATTPTPTTPTPSQPTTATAPLPVGPATVPTGGQRPLPPGIKRKRPGATKVVPASPPPRPVPPLVEDERRRPGPPEPPRPPEPKPLDTNKSGLEPVVPPPPDLPRDFVPIPDRWRLAKDLGIVQENWYDPYNRNLLKSDRPFYKDWFFNVAVISDTVLEPRRVPTPVAPQISRGSGSVDVFGGDEQMVFNQALILGLVVFKGDTVFRPPDYEFRLTPVFNYNYVKVNERRVLKINPDNGTSREDSHVGLQEAFADVHLRNVSDRYDFDSIRVGIQPFSTDFRGFLFQDNQLGIRLFGNRDNNIWQYNLAWFRRLEKDTNSGLNDTQKALRNDDVFIANLYHQDLPVRGFTSQATVVYNRNREGGEAFFYDENGFLARPASFGLQNARDYDVTYFGLNGDGHFGRLNLTVSAYYAYGNESPGVFTNENTDIRSWFGAAEAGWDFDWIRLRLSLLYARGDDDPFDDTAQGFDAIFENPIFAGADTSYWIRQAIPLVGGGGVVLSPRNGVLPSLRSSKEQGQSNFTNPGLRLYGIGADFDVTPEWRLSTNFNKLYFDNTAVLEVARNQGRIDSDIGWDLSAALIYRPYFSQNIVFRLSGAVLIPGDGTKALYGDDNLYSVLGNLVLAY